MIDIKLIFRYYISEVVYPSVDTLIVSNADLNLISFEGFRKEIEKRENELATKIRFYINEGNIVPPEFWCASWTSKIIEDSINVLIYMNGSVGQFQEFEKYIESKNYKLVEIVYLKVNDINKLTELAKQKYPEIYDQTDAFRKEIEDFQLKRDEIVHYSKSKYKVTINDFFIKEINL